MQVYTRIVLDMATGDVLAADGYEHDGPVALCKGGGGGSQTTTTVDYEYNNRMATIAEQQQGMAREYYDFWKSDYKPYEQAQIQANREMIDQAKPLRDKFISESLEGVNPETVAAQARSDAEASVSGAEMGAARSLSRYGLNPDSGAFQDTLGRAATLNRARTVSQSANSARAMARAEAYERLKIGAGLGLPQ